MLVVVSGPSASGKDVIAQRIVSEHPTEIAFAITATTRQPRPGESDGEHYYFRTPEEFADMERRGLLLESATVYGLRYGVPRASVRETLTRAPIAFVRTDIQGAASIKSLIPEALLIFINVPDVATLERRMRARGGIDETPMAQRLAEARAEMERAAQFDYTVNNEDSKLDDAVAQTWSIIKRESENPERRLRAL